MEGLKTWTLRRAYSARRARRISSSDLPANIDPHTIVSEPILDVRRDIRLFCPRSVTSLTPRRPLRTSLQAHWPHPRPSPIPSHAPVSGSPMATPAPPLL